MDEDEVPRPGTHDEMDLCVDGALTCLFAAMASAVMLRDVGAVVKLAAAIDAANEARWYR